MIQRAFLMVVFMYDGVMPHRILEKCTAWYARGSCGENEPATPDVIVPISYCATPRGLSHATRENMARAIEYAKQFPHAVTVFCNADYVFAGAAEIERSEKKRLFRESSIPDVSVKEAGGITNSVQEARAIRACLTENRIPQKRILLITGAMHAPSASLIWRRVFPKAEIAIRCIPSALETQADHSIIAVRSTSRWFIANVIRHLMLLTLGLDITEKFHHLVSSPKSDAQ